MDTKICGIKNLKTLEYIIKHNDPPKFIGFIYNFKKSKRNVEYVDLKKFTKVKKKNINFVVILVKPNNNILEELKNLNFEYYQLYNVSPEETKEIKKKYKKKIITAITIENKNDVKEYKKYIGISDIILFDSKGYEKSIKFNHNLLKNTSNSIIKMIAGNIQYDEKLDKYLKMADIIDISGSLETLGEKDISKINIFLNNMKKINDKN